MPQSTPRRWLHMKNPRPLVTRSYWSCGPMMNGPYLRCTPYSVVVEHAPSVWVPAPCLRLAHDGLDTRMTFRHDGRGRHSLYETFDELFQGGCTAADITPIEIVVHPKGSSYFWSLSSVKDASGAELPRLGVGKRAARGRGGRCSSIGPHQACPRCWHSEAWHHESGRWHSEACVSPLCRVVWVRCVVRSADHRKFETSHNR